jgi:hypothetical protein
VIASPSLVTGLPAVLSARRHFTRQRRLFHPRPAPFAPPCARELSIREVEVPGADGLRLFVPVAGRNDLEVDPGNWTAIAQCPRPGPGRGPTVHAAPKRQIITNDSHSPVMPCTPSPPQKPLPPNAPFP